jgi:hypothetical protein
VWVIDRAYRKFEIDWGKLNANLMGVVGKRLFEPEESFEGRFKSYENLGVREKYFKWARNQLIPYFWGGGRGYELRLQE